MRDVCSLIWLALNGKTRLSPLADASDRFYVNAIMLTRGGNISVIRELSGTDITCSTFQPVNRLTLRPIPVRTRYRGRGASHV
jgi:hypothetical protein